MCCKCNEDSQSPNNNSPDIYWAFSIKQAHVLLVIDIIVYNTSHMRHIHSPRWLAENNHDAIAASRIQPKPRQSSQFQASIVIFPFRYRKLVEAKRASDERIYMLIVEYALPGFIIKGERNPLWSSFFFFLQNVKAILLVISLRLLMLKDSATVLYIPCL